MYGIVVSKSAAKDLQALPKTQVPKIVQAIDQLAENPRPPGCKKLKGQTEDFWRIRQGDYRIVYFISDTVQVVDIRRIRHRREAYD